MIRKFFTNVRGNSATITSTATADRLRALPAFPNGRDALSEHAPPSRRPSAFRRFADDRNGNFAAAVGLLLVPMLLAGGLAVDSTNINRVKTDVQTALDAASMQIAVNVSSGLDDAALEALGQEYFEANLGSADPAAASFDFLGITVEPDGSQHLLTSANYDYEVLVPRTLAGNGDSASTASLALDSGIRSRSGDLACVYALNHTAPRAIDAGGATSVIMDGCVLASNSNAADSIYVGGSASIAADCIQSSGGVDATVGLTVDCEQIRLNAWRLPDPFRDVQEPLPPANRENSPNKTDPIVYPGRYSNLSLDGTHELQPGLYYVEGSLSIKGDISGSGVTFFMADGGITINGNASLSLTAPEAPDPYAGLLFMSARNNTSDHKFNGTGATDLNGVLYFPASPLTYNGNNATTTTCMRIVADTIVLTGSSNIRSDCSEELGGREARVAGPLYFFK